MLVMVAKRMARASRVGPIHAAISLRLSVGQVALDGVTGDHRHVDQQAEGDDQGGDRHLLDVDAQHQHGPEA